MPFGERSGLVGDEQVEVAQVFDAHQPFDEHLAFGERPGSGSETRAHHGGEQLRGDADRDGQGEEQRFDQGAVEQQVGDEDQRSQYDGHFEQEDGEPGETPLEIGLRLLRAESDSDPPEDGVRAGRDDDARSASGLDDGAHEGATGQVAQARTRRHCSSVLRDGHRLTCHDALVALQVVAAEQAEIGRNDGSHAHGDHVARHQFDHVDCPQRSVAEDEGLVPDLVVECIRRPLRTELIDESQTDAEHQDHRDDHGIRCVAEKRGDDRGDEEQDQDGALQLSAQHQPRTRPMTANGIRSDDGEPVRSLIRGQTLRPRVGIAQSLVDRPAGRRAKLFGLAGFDGASVLGGHVSVSHRDQVSSV